MSPRTFDDIPVSTVFAEEKSRENSDTRKSTTSLKSQNSRKISRESRDSKKSEKSEKSNQSENEPDSESVETAKKLKKQLEDTIRKHLRNTININENVEGWVTPVSPQNSIKWGVGSQLSSPLYCPMQNSDRMTVGKTHPTLILLEINMKNLFNLGQIFA